MKEPMSIEDPAEFVAQLFRTMLERRGITIRGKTRARHGEGAQFFDQQIAHPIPANHRSAAFVRQSVRCVQPCSRRSRPISIQRTSNKILAEHFSAPLLDDIRVTNKSARTCMPSLRSSGGQAARRWRIV